MIDPLFIDFVQSARKKNNALSPDLPGYGNMTSSSVI
jgi:hypothetical protein